MIDFKGFKNFRITQGSFFGSISGNSKQESCKIFNAYFQQYLKEQYCNLDSYFTYNKLED